MKKASVLIIENTKHQYLFLLRAVKPYGLGFPGGKFNSDFDKNMSDTCLREVFEEIGILFSRDSIFYLGEIISINGTPVSVYHTFVNEIETITLNPKEHLTSKWLSLSEFNGKVFAGKTLDFLNLLTQKQNG